jgi:hypothetical protein
LSSLIGVKGAFSGFYSKATTTPAVHATSCATRAATKGTTFAYLLFKVKDWNSGKTQIQELEDDTVELTRAGTSGIARRHWVVPRRGADNFWVERSWRGRQRGRCRPHRFHPTVLA